MLSKDHRVYKGDFVRGADLASVTQSLRGEGLDVSSPVGNFPPRFVLLLKGAVPGEVEGSAHRNPDWVVAREVFRKNDEIFQDYCDLMLGGYVPPTRELDVFHFGTPGFMASQLAHLVAKGRKRLTAGWVASHEKAGVPIPAAGWVSIVTDGFGIPIACIETERFERLKFREVTAEMAEREGEGDLSLADWKRGHWKYWTEVEAPGTGLTFTEDSEIFIEGFRVHQVFSGQFRVEKPLITMMVGLTGSGKTTLGRSLAQERGQNFYAIDEWMRNLSWADQPKGEAGGLSWALERCARCELQIERMLEREVRAGRGAILDLGFSKIEERSAWRAKIEKLGARVELIYLDVPADTRWQRVSERNQKLVAETQAIAVDRETFDWMEKYFEPLGEEERLVAKIARSSQGPSS